MKYQIVSLQRSGTKFLSCWIDQSFGEFFLKRTKQITDEDWQFMKNSGDIGIYVDDIKSKFNWLQKQNRQHSFTVNNLAFLVRHYPNFLDRLIQFYKGYHLLTIKRNSWDRFLSLHFQDCTNWKHSHITWDPGNDFRMIMKKYDIDRFIKEEKEHNRLLNIVLKNATKYTVIDYENLNKQYLNNFFNKNIIADYKPMNIDYEKYIDDIDYWKCYFNLEEYYNE
jgi:hypothetical protein